METTATTASADPRRYSRLEWLKFALFWSWNLVFLAFMSLGFAPTMLPNTLTAVGAGLIPPLYLVFGLVLALIPVIVIVLGLTVLRRSPNKLFALGYVIEGPLMLMLAVRFFAIRQGTPGVTWLIILALAGMAGFLWNLLDPQAGQRRPWVEAVRLCGLTLMALVALYAAAWIAFYAIPMVVEGVRVVSENLQELLLTIPAIFEELGRMLREQPLMVPFSVLGLILAMYTATLFVLTPIVVPILSLSAWWNSFSGITAASGKLRPALLASATLLASLGLFYLANQQPQARAFALLETPPSTADQARVLLGKSEAIRKGLLNAYLAQFRYFSAEGEVTHVRDLYAYAFRISPQKAAAVQRSYEKLASPLLYKPVNRPDWNHLVDNRALVEEPQEAARLYQQFFDTPITEAERRAIVNSARSTWSPDQAEAAWQAVDDREVYLAQQELTVQEHGDWAELELHEAYENQTGERQEVVYYFSLPESAALTGVWLGSTPDKSRADAYQVAPRGAAQQVYREQMRRGIDPALLEQIGPRQYRLRIFPVPAMQTNYDTYTSRVLLEDAPPLHMWLSWQEMADGNEWPLPQLTLLRNVYWDGKSERLVNGQPSPAEQDEWLPESAPVARAAEPAAHRVDFPGGQSVLAVPAGRTVAESLPEGLDAAVVVDRSYSLHEHSAEMSAALARLKELEKPDAPLDAYLTASPYRGEQPSVVPLADLDLLNMVYYGGQNAVQLLDQFRSVRAAERPDRNYDAVIVLTDGSGYELGPTTIGPVDNAIPIWIVHLGSDISLGYDDQTLEAIQSSGGGVAGSLDEALARIAAKEAVENDAEPSSAPVVDLVDGYRWTVLPTGQARAATGNLPVQAHQANDPFAALAARRLILAHMQQNRGQIGELETLDALHALAQQQGIVTPYSSMIVLVNLEQKKMLETLSGQSDRFQREYENPGETDPNALPPLAGVPEPHEWLLIGLATAMLVYYVYTKKGRLVEVS